MREAPRVQRPGGFGTVWAKSWLGGLAASWKGWGNGGAAKVDEGACGRGGFGRQQPGSVQALDRGLALLEIIAQADGLSLTSIAQRAGIAASTAHRILATLKAAGFVQCDEARGGYLIGVKAFKIGSAFLRNRKLVDVGRGVMRDLMAASGETTNLGIENDGYVVFVSQLESHHRDPRLSSARRARAAARLEPRQGHPGVAAGGGGHARSCIASACRSSPTAPSSIRRPCSPTWR